MNAYDQRQYLKMMELIEGFKKRTIQIDNFLTNIEALLDLLEEPDPNWKKKFRGEWGEIETTYAVALDKKHAQFCPEEQDYIDQSIDRMEKLLRQLELEKGDGVEENF